MYFELTVQLLLAVNLFVASLDAPQTHYATITLSSYFYPIVPKP
jgi:hypothetical protein